MNAFMLQNGIWSMNFYKIVRPYSRSPIMPIMKNFRKNLKHESIHVLDRGAAFCMRRLYNSLKFLAKYGINENKCKWIKY